MQFQWSEVEVPTMTSAPQICLRMVDSRVWSVAKLEANQGQWWAVLLTDPYRNIHHCDGSGKIVLASRVEHVLWVEKMVCNLFLMLNFYLLLGIYQSRSLAMSYSMEVRRLRWE
jgi:hypothetical protein